MKKKTGEKYAPFIGSERAAACELIAKTEIELKKAREKVKDLREQLDKLVSAVQRGGHLNDKQLELGASHIDDVLDGENDKGDERPPPSKTAEIAMDAARKRARSKQPDVSNGKS